ncbi:MAG: Ig-like domain-containing protein [Clostridia bacterium]|nr:Ig-like domain-containing protein [Clostridia bacterium]
MKKFFGTVSSVKIILALFLLAVISVCLVGFSSSSYNTTTTQYSTVSTVTPYILNDEIKISFLNDKNKVTTSTSVVDPLYVKSGYSTATNSGYLMKLENIGRNSTSGLYGVSDYYDAGITSTNAVDFIDYFGVTKSDYGSLTFTDTSGDKTTYDEPLVTEWSAGSQNLSATTVNIAPFSTKVTVTVYFTMGSKMSQDGSAVDRSSPYTAFYFNADEKVYYPDSTSGTTSAGLIKCDNNTYGSYTFKAGSKTVQSTHNLYVYQDTVDAEEAINISTATQSQATIFLIVLSPVTEVAVSNGNTSGSTTESVLSTGGTVDITTTANTTNWSLKNTSSDTPVWTTSDSTVATVSGNGYNATVTAQGAGTATIYVTVGGVTASYNVTVYGVALADSEVFIDYSIDVTANLYPSSDSATYEWSINNTSYATIGSSTTNTVTVKGVAAGTATLTVKATVNGTEYTASCTITVSKYVLSNATVNLTSLVDAGTLSATTYDEDIELYSNIDGTEILATASSSKTISIDSSSKTTIEGEVFTNRLKLGGTGSDTARSIKFTVASNCNITVYMVSSSSDDNRTVYLYGSDFSTKVATSTVSTTAAKYTYENIGAGTYYLATESGGLNIYYLAIEYPSVTISGNSEVKVGSTIDLTANLTAISSYTSIEWSSSDTAVATVSADASDVTKATLSGVKAGEVTITVTVDGTYTATYTVTVKDVLEISGDSSVVAGSTLTLKALLNGTEISSSDVTWSSSDTDVATVSDGVVTGVAAGTAKITATSSSGATATLEVTVNAATLALTKSTDIIEYSAGTVDLNNYVSSETNVNTSDITWSVESGNATVSGDTLTLTDAGEVEVKATYNNLTASITFKVLSVATVIIEEESVTITAGGTGTANYATYNVSVTDLTWTVTDTANGNTVTGITAANGEDNKTLTITVDSSVTEGSYEVTLTGTSALDSSITVSDTITVIVTAAVTEYTVTYVPTAAKTLTGTYTGTEDSSSTNVIVVSNGNSGTDYSSNSYGSAIDGTTYSYHSQINDANRTVKITIGKNVTAKIVVEGYVSNASRYMYIGGTCGDTSSYLDCEGGEKKAVELTAENITEGTYYIYSGGDTVYLYAIKITYTVSN